MNKIAHVLVAAVIVLVLAPVVVAQECSMQTITGVYVYRGTGQSFVGGAPFALTVTPDAARGVLPLHAPGTYLNGSQLGVLTVHPDGAVNTVTWVAMGPFRLDPAGDKLPARVASVGWEQGPGGDDLGCAATIEYVHPTLGPGRDKFIVFDNGKEIRGIHALTGNPITTSLFVGKRVTPSLDAAPAAHTLNGSYVASCPRGLLYNANGTTVSIASMLDLKTLPGGALTGTAMNRIENQFSETPVRGAFTLNALGLGEGHLEGLLPGLPAAKGHFVLFMYDEGKGGFLLPTELELPGGARVPYPTTQSCTLERMAR